MTIIQPNKNRDRISLILYGLLIVLVFLLSQGIYLYSQSVALKHDIEKFQKQIRGVEAASVEMKKSLISLFEEESLKEIIEGNKLIEEKNPKFIKTTDKLLAQR